MLRLMLKRISYYTAGCFLAWAAQTEWSIYRYKRCEREYAERQEHARIIQQAFAQKMEECHDIEFKDCREKERRNIIESVPIAEQAGKLLELERQSDILKAVRAKERAARDSGNGTVHPS
ncbi:MAG: hypothetical protein OHK93_002129 [Ramalina farinacea]|uniref:Uncharacterized protein n=1 Tax=Ramalina farinacea TaxID=258253 RepID=A0AA43QST9_9LECA|nr:hypothetical protein [Ramalina farinacea]